METPGVRLRVRRRWIVLVGLLALVLVFVWAQDKADWIIFYRVTDEHTLSVGVTGDPAWTRVAGVTETPTSVVVAVRTFVTPLPGFADNAIELTIHLTEPIGERTVIDASTGQPIRFTKCSDFPAYRSPGCP